MPSFFVAVEKKHTVDEFKTEELESQVRKAVHRGGKRGKESE